MYYKDYIKLTISNWADTSDKNNSTNDALGDLFAYITAHKKLYITLKERELLHYLKVHIFDMLGPKDEYDNITAYTTAFISSGIYGWIEEWFSRGMIESGEEMAELLKNR